MMMTGTIESTNNSILVKLRCLREISAILTECGLPPPPRYIRELSTITSDYELGSIKILADYFLLVKQCVVELKNDLKPARRGRPKSAGHDGFNEKQMAFYKKYQMFIQQENFIGKMDRLYTIFWENIQVNKKRNAALPAHVKLRACLSQYKSFTVQHSMNNVVYNKCGQCKKEMKIIPTSSEMVCIYCGSTEMLSGTVFEDEQFYYQEGQRTKHGAYDPSKHCRFWIDRIQAHESKPIPDAVINAIKVCIRRDKIKNIEEITCGQIRSYLRQTRNAAYNEHVPLIRKIITGITPPQLTDKEIQLIILIFNKAILIYEEIKSPEKTNVMYHPYPIYKIIEHMLNAPRDRQRACLILCCIHLQSRETLIENDITWREICKRMDDVKYVPTECHSATFE